MPFRDVTTTSVEKKLYCRVCDALIFQSRRMYHPFHSEDFCKSCAEKFLEETGQDWCWFGKHTVPKGELYQDPRTNRFIPDGEASQCYECRLGQIADYLDWLRPHLDATDMLAVLRDKLMALPIPEPQKPYDLDAI